MTQNRIILLVGMLTMTVSILSSQNILTLDSTTLTKNELVTGVEIPWELKWGPDDYLWFTQRNGKIFRTDPTTGNTTEILDITAKVNSGSEAGMLGMCFHPDFENNPQVYVVYNYGSLVNEKLVRFDWLGDTLTNEQIILDNIGGAVWHNGSRLLITEDNKILMTCGDHLTPQNVQNLLAFAGKILRINLDGSIPEDNPFPDRYIYTLGHRNPQGLSYGPNGNIYITEHGTYLSDEINILSAGGNYGWPNSLGYCDSPDEIEFCEENNVIEPIYDWSPCYGVSDLVYYTHSAIPEWQGKLLVTVLGGNGTERFPRISVMSFNDDKTEIIADDWYFEDFGRIRDVCINPHSGSIYFATNGIAYPGSGPNQIIEYKNVDYISSTKPVQFDSQSMNINPNPASDIIKLSCDERLLGSKYEIFSYSGELIQQGVISETVMNLAIDKFEQGQYFIRAQNNNGQLSRSFSIFR